MHVDTKGSVLDQLYDVITKLDRAHWAAPIPAGATHAKCATCREDWPCESEDATSSLRAFAAYLEDTVLVGDDDY